MYVIDFSKSKQPVTLHDSTCSKVSQKEWRCIPGFESSDQLIINKNHDKALYILFTALNSQCTQHRECESQYRTNQPFIHHRHKEAGFVENEKRHVLSTGQKARSCFTQTLVVNRSIVQCPLNLTLISAN